ncbi:MAG: hypothetical protein GX080_06055 [Tissierellia bacterium]|nr:hypothetical protein [Tissierellia bacterium]
MDKKVISSWIIKLIIIILIGIILFFSYKGNQQKFINFINTLTAREQTLEVVNSISIENPVEKVLFHEDKILVCGSDNLSIYDLEGQREWEKEFTLDSPKMLFGKERIYVYDSRVGDIYSLNFEGNTLGRLPMGSEIKNMTESKGNLLVHTVGERGEELKILSLSGNIVGTKSIEDSRILTYCIDDNKKIYAISTLSLRYDTIKTEIQVYDMKGQLVSTFPLNDEISMYMEFLEENKLLVMTDKGLYLLKDGTAVWEREEEGVKDIYVDKSNNIYILKDEVIVGILPDGNVKDKHYLAHEYDRIVPFKNNLVLWGSNHIIGLQGGKEVFSYESKDEIYDVVEGNGYLIVVYYDRIELMEGK